MNTLNRSLKIIKDDENARKGVLSVELMNNDYKNLIGPELFPEDSLITLCDLPVSDVGIIAELFNGTYRITTSGKTTLIADFDHLPVDVKQKLADGIYSIGESKQVDGNLRAVILDENGIRTKDITMKKVVESSELTDVTRSIGIQMQLHQIMDKLTDISDLQDFLVERERDNSIHVPFLNARDYILRAQRAQSHNEVIMNLNEASRELTTAMNAIYTDCETSSNSLAKIVKRPVFQSTTNRNRFIGYIVEDIQIAHKYVQIFLALLNYRMDYSASFQVAERYKVFVDDIFTKQINGRSVTQMLQEYYPYTSENRNCWYTLMKTYEGLALNALPESIIVLSIEGA